MVFLQDSFKDKTRVYEKAIFEYHINEWNYYG